MKKVQSFLYPLIVLVISFTFSSAAQSQNNLVANWKFDEVKGKFALDEVSHTYDSIHYIFNTISPYHDPIRRKGILDSA